MAYVSDEYLDKLKAEHSKLAALQSKWTEVTKFVEAATACGFANQNQEDALIYALTRLTDEPEIVIRLKLDVKARGHK